MNLKIEELRLNIELWDEEINQLQQAVFTYIVRWNRRNLKASCCLPAVMPSVRS